MDILAKLRLLFWALVLGLWGLFMFQFLFRGVTLKTVKHEVAQLRDPFASMRPKPYEGPPPVDIVASVPEARYNYTKVDLPVSPLPQASIPSQQRTDGMLMPVNDGSVAGVADKDDRTAVSGQGAPAAVAKPELAPRPQQPSWPPVPQGFSQAETRHFIVYREGSAPGEDLLSTLDDLHGNLMIDLVAFTPWTRDGKVLIYLFSTREAYQQVTGRPGWSGGASSASQRTIYVVEGPEALGILAHELTHIYFDSFWNTSNPNPLWLSEGMAVYIQSERGQSPPGWLTDNMALLQKGGGYKMQDLMNVDDFKDMSGDNVKLWYAQSYSLVRFLMHMRTGDSFYQFCRQLRDGSPVNEALFRAYGMPFNKVASLEYAWRYDVQTGKIAIGGK